MLNKVSFRILFLSAAILINSFTACIKSIFALHMLSVKAMGLALESVLKLHLRNDCFLLSIDSSYT